MSEPLTTWRACALYATSLLERAYLDPQLAPHLAALQAAIASLRASEAAPPLPPPIPTAQPQTATPEPPPQAQPSPWAAAAPGAAPAWVASPAPAEPAWMPPPPPRAVVEATPMATAAPAPGTPAATQAEPPLAPMTVVTFGSNDKGLLGQGFMRPPNWEPAREITGEIGPVIAVAASAANVALIGRGGQLFLTGTNAGYLFADRVGRGRELPTAVEALQGRVVSRVFLGATTTHMFAVVDGKLFGWGRQANALGVDVRSPQLQPRAIERVGKLTGSGGVPGERIRQMALSIGHTVALLADGSLWSSGTNARGQLGQGAKGNPHETHLFGGPEGLGSTQFQAVSCGPMHTACVSADGGLFTCGRNEAGELGHEDPADHYRLTRVTTGSIAGLRVAQVVCGAQSTLCLTVDGKLHVAGSNDKGAIGLGDAPYARAFVELPLPGGKTVKQVAAGAKHALALTHDGEVFAWGDNYLGQVTPGSNGKPVTSPTPVRDVAGQRVVGVCAGAEHSVVMIGA
jgi:alpha-tubulin suppressor-like RCC1 family protein